MLKLLLPMASLAVCIALSVGVANADVSLVNQYDLSGNLVSGDGKYYEYNDANQLVRVRENDQNGKVVAEYFYDFSGQRVKKVENGVTSYYIGKHFETQVVTGQAKDTAHFFVDNERVAKRDDSGTYFYHPDHLGGTNVVTNASGTVVARNSYLPFGEMREGGQEKYSYTGKEKDTATDLYYFESRFNSPELRHFTQADIADPDLNDPQDLNRYAYVGNNPLSYVDPDGHKKKKKAKLSKREKWMLAHGVDPDHDKTSLKKAKAQLKAGNKYTVGSKHVTPKAYTATLSSSGNEEVARNAEPNNTISDGMDAHLTDNFMRDWRDDEPTQGQTYIRAATDDELIQRRFKEQLDKNGARFVGMNDRQEAVLRQQLYEQARREVLGPNYVPPTTATQSHEWFLWVLSFIDK